MLFLVRHAEPHASPQAPPAAWPLTAAGAAASARLRETLPPDALLVSSNEVKAWMTLGGKADVIRDDRFGEVRRRDEPWAGDWRSKRRRYVQGEHLDGWEDREDVTARFEEAILEHSAAAAGRPLVVASHGMAITSWLVSREMVSRHGAGDFWEELRFPDVLRVDLRTPSWDRPHVS